MKNLMMTYTVAFGLFVALLMSASAQTEKSTGVAPNGRHHRQITNAERRVVQRKFGPEDVILKKKNSTNFQIVNRMVIDQTIPTFPVNVDPALCLSAASLAQYQQVANTLSGYTGVPQSRLDYYAALVNSNNYTIVGWQGILENLNIVDTGYLVTIKVIPALAAPSGITSNFSEQNLVIDNSIQFQSSADPQGLAGLIPPEIDEY